MSIEKVRLFLLWCTVINYAILLLWGLLFMFPNAWLYRLWSRWFRLPAEQIDALNFSGMAVYKIGIFLFNLVPYVALCIVG